jgi:hypothetical protein
MCPGAFKGVLVLAHPERQIYDVPTKKIGCRAQLVLTGIAKVQAQENRAAPHAQ